MTMLLTSAAMRLKEFRALRKLRSEGRNALPGFFIFRYNIPSAIAVDAKKTLVPIKYISTFRGMGSDGVREMVERVKEACDSEVNVALVSGIQDRLQYGFSVGEYFKNVIRVEPGLLFSSSRQRSVSSYILNHRGIYFDGRSSSDLEEGLNALLPGYASRSSLASAVVEKVISEEFTKYDNLTDTSERTPRDSLLIVGQCNGDQAIEQTTALVKNNKDLIKYIMEQGPIADVSQVFYKPHPLNKENEKEMEWICSRYPNIRMIPFKSNLLPLLRQRPRVAVITSGAGLEAALRGCEVHCFGISFYSNWGFTEDYCKCCRRINRLTPDDVFAYVLINQMSYVDTSTMRKIPVEEAYDLDEFVNCKNDA